MAKEVVSNDLVEALRMKVEALQTMNEALQMKIRTLEIRRGPGRPRLSDEERLQRQYVRSNNGRRKPKPVSAAPEEMLLHRRGRRPLGKSGQIRKLQGPLNMALHEMLKDGNYNSATYKALTGIMLCMYENGFATVNMLNQYIGGARVTVVRHTSLLKRMGLIRYEGSRKKGHYAMTEKGKEFMDGLAQRHRMPA